MEKIQGYLQDGDGNLLLPNTTTSCVADTAKRQALATTLANVDVNIGINNFVEFTEAMPYKIGDVVRHADNLFLFTADHAPGAWNPGHVTATSVLDLAAEASKAGDKELADRLTHMNALISDNISKIGALNASVADINRDMGKYQQLPDVTLTLVESGKRIDKDGKFVADAQWNIGRLGAVSKGNIYELLMGGSDKMVLGTALFVSHTVEKIGSKDTDVYKPIFSAVTTDLPISNYAVLLAGEDYADVLVSYRADVTGSNVMLVSRWGIFASLATQYANLKKAVDLKSFADGYYKNMRVGNADTLTIGSTAPTYTETLGGRQVNNAPEMMGTRDAASTNSTSNISVQEVAGGVVVGDQMVKNPNFAEGTSHWLPRGGYRLYMEDGACTSSAGSAPYIRPSEEIPFNGHTMLLFSIARWKGLADGESLAMYYRNWATNKTYSVFNVTNEWKPFFVINNTGDTGVTLLANANESINMQAKCIGILDLTLLPQLPTTFVTSLDSNDAIKVAHKLSFFAYDRTAANAVTHDKSATLAKMAEIVAKMGYQEPKYTWAGVGRYNLVDGNTGRIKQSIDKIAQKTNAWNKALEILRAGNYDVPEFVQKPIEFGIDNGDARVKWTNVQLEINCWVVDMGNLNWQYVDQKFRAEFYKKSSWGGVGEGLLSAKYPATKSSTLTGMQDKEMGTIGSYIYIMDSDYTNASAFREAVRGQYLIYKLATPITIPLDEPMNINFVDAKPYDLYTLDDMDGEPMYEVEVTPRTDGTYHTVVAPKAEWVEQHKSLPITIKAALAGIGTNVGYDFIMNLEQRIRNLENK